MASALAPWLETTVHTEESEQKNHFALLEALRPVLIFFVTFVALLSGVDVSDM